MEDYSVVQGWIPDAGNDINETEGNIVLCKSRQSPKKISYVIPSIPLSLWGRNILSQMGMLLYSPDEKVTVMPKD